MTRALRLGLTGGIGSGKSTVAAMLAELGAAVIDADAIARSVTATGGAAIAAIHAAFGADFIDASGAMNRGRMRELAYTNADARQRLEAIIHPLVSQQTWQQAAQAEAGGHRCLVFDVPLLVESNHWRARVDRVIVVDCTPASQIDRVVARSGLTPSAVEAILAAQSPRLRRLKAADAVIFNEGISLPVLRSQVNALARDLGLSSGQTNVANIQL